MARLCVNPLSAASQFNAILEVEAAFTEVVRCFQHIRVALETKRIELIYDDSLEMQRLQSESGGLHSELNRISNRDVRVQWFIYTRNHASKAQSPSCTVRVAVAGGGRVREGRLREEIADESVRWLSFGGDAISEQDLLTVRKEGAQVPLAISNACALEKFSRWWPRYEASAKHGSTGYYRDTGEYVSPMPLNQVVAQEVLMASILCEGDRYGIYKGEYFRFLQTRIDAEIYHGFLVAFEDVPDDIVADLVDIASSRATPKP